MNMHAPDLVTQVVSPTCQHCGEPFTPREGSGGKAQRFCSPEHRADYHAQRRQRESLHVGEAASTAPKVADADKDAPTASQMREMLINAGRAFDEKFPQASVEEATDRVMADMARDGSMGSGVAIDDDGFDWAASDSIVVPEQRNTAAYLNKDGDLVIRQEAGWNETEDQFVLIARPNIEAFIDKLTDALGIPSAGW